MLKNVACSGFELEHRDKTRWDIWLDIWREIWLHAMVLVGGSISGEALDPLGVEVFFLCNQRTSLVMELTRMQIFKLVSHQSYPNMSAEAEVQERFNNGRIEGKVRFVDKSRKEMTIVYSNEGTPSFLGSFRAS